MTKYVYFFNISYNFNFEKLLSIFNQLSALHLQLVACKK